MYLVLLIFWFIFSGKVTVEIAIFGLAAAALVLFFSCRFLGWSLRREICTYRLAPHIILYILTLIIEIVKAALSVMPYIWGRKHTPDGVIVEFDPGLTGATAVAVLANSITLTPGTITVSVHDGVFTVHCLSPEFTNGLDDSVFVKRLRKMEGIARKGREKA